MKKTMLLVPLLALLTIPTSNAADDGGGSFYQYQSSGFAVPIDHFGAQLSASAAIDLNEATPATVSADATADLYRVLVGRHPTPEGTILFRFIVWRPGVVPDVVFDTTFLGNDNMVNFADPTVVMIPYWALSVTDGVAFQMDGGQVSRFVSAAGFYQDENVGFRFVVSAHTVSV